MMAFQLIPGVLIEAMLASLLAGLILYPLFALMLRLLPRNLAAVKYLLCNAGLLFMLGCFLNPFIQEALRTHVIASQPVQHGSSIVEGRHAYQALSADAATPDVTFEARLSSISGSVSGWLDRHSNAILLVYLCGLIFFLLKLAVNYYRMQKLRSGGLLPPDVSWQTAMDATLDRLGIRRRVRLAFSERIEAPCIVGWAKAIVLVPVALANKLSAAQAEAVLLHELAHYRQYHHYINLAAQVAATLQFFNPFVWLILRMGIRYREYSCDAFAIRFSRQLELAESLLIIAEHHRHPNPSLALSLHPSKNQLLKRIQNLLHMKRSTSSLRVIIVTILIAVVSACGFYGTLRAIPRPAAAAATDTLAVISRLLREKGNDNYIIVEALRDSLLRFGVPYSFAYDAAGVAIDGVLLEEPYQSRYRTMIQSNPRFTHTASWSVRGDSLTRKSMLDTGSNYYRVQVVPQIINTHYTGTKAATNTEFPEPKFDSKAVVSALIADRLVDTLSWVEIMYRGTELFVNNRQLTGEMRAKYELVLRKYMQFEPAAPGLRTSTRIYPEGVVAPQVKNGNSVIQFPRRPTEVPYLRIVDEADPHIKTWPTIYASLKDQLATDGLADTAYSVHIVYSTKGLFVNDEPLAGEALAKYKAILAATFNYKEPKRETQSLDLAF